MPHPCIGIDESDAKDELTHVVDEKKPGRTLCGRKVVEVHSVESDCHPTHYGATCAVCESRCHEEHGHHPHS